ncbi:hypothetical protein C5B42_06145 [Candidatus Cerribacteria bacterium 'Amazon FNV 2010 28 9']|uniref:Mannosyl-glycoprotein endo-beta-N-acetylglucosamidase-like domain-containing protein n=1 Tax=Candidatus Cerribacteria bacterium 'Amazon FNV 2010 28 9' TaxID=2081795 RepID=A0A317JPE0_9BACT|nr:MAG: hypothetical protein C5B42_06145 [Candidatus Cerribacteria bacterium 'Amazon FNV 2010 28 9']
MIKQPKRFYTKSIEKPQEIEESICETSQEAIGQPSQFHFPRLPFQSTLLFVAGTCLVCSIAVIAIAPSIIPPLHLEQKGNQVNQTLLQAGGSDATGLHFEAQVSDARVDIVQNFLERYDSPLKPYDHYAEVLVQTADRYGLDYRLLPAIMMQESNLCKTADPSIHNCLGFGINKAGTLAFNSYEDSFDRAARELKERYIDQGLTTPEEIMTKYTPSSNGSWARSVNQWLNEMEYDSHQKGLENDGNTNLMVYSKSDQ